MDGRRLEAACRRGLEPVLAGITARFEGGYTHAELTDDELRGLRVLTLRRMRSALMDRPRYAEAVRVTLDCIEHELVVRGTRREV